MILGYEECKDILEQRLPTELVHKILFCPPILVSPIKTELLCMKEQYSILYWWRTGDKSTMLIKDSFGPGCPQCGLDSPCLETKYMCSFCQFSECDWCRKTNGTKACCEKERLKII